MGNFRNYFHDYLVAMALAVGLTVAAMIPAYAALPEGAKAPDFKLSAALGGKPFEFSLDKALQKGPVVLYFFPAAFTKGCTLEAHLFADQTANFKKAGATVIGVTAGNVDRVADFSKLACRNKFAVAADPGAQIADKYQSTVERQPGQLLSDRTSYVIAPDGTILLSHTDKNPQTHIEATLDAVKAWKAKQH